MISKAGWSWLNLRHLCWQLPMYRCRPRADVHWVRTVLGWTFLQIPTGLDFPQASWAAWRPQSGSWRDWSSQPKGKQKGCWLHTPRTPRLWRAATDCVSGWQLLSLYLDMAYSYTFWTYMMNPWAKNVGWCLDYFLLSESLLPALWDSKIHSKAMDNDHSPIILYLALWYSPKAPCAWENITVSSSHHC